MKKIAFCFLIYDIINHEELWNIFFKNVDFNRYNIYIHYKTNVTLKFFDKYKLNNCIETKWGDISLVKAQNLLLEEGLKDTNNLHFIFLSNSCIPLKSFDIVYNSLDVLYSYFNLFPDGQCFPFCNIVLNYIDSKYISKAHQWCILNKKHAKLMIDNSSTYLEWFGTSITGPDEYCYITTINYLNLQNEIITTMNSSINATTFTNWTNMNYKYMNYKYVNYKYMNYKYMNYNSQYYKNYHNTQVCEILDSYNMEYCSYGLKNYNSISNEELQYLLNNKCLFGRKFNKCINLLNNYYNNYINFITYNNINVL